jgi:hypothetical protein
MLTYKVKIDGFPEASILSATIDISRDSVEFFLNDNIITIPSLNFIKNVPTSIEIKVSDEEETRIINFKSCKLIEHNKTIIFNDLPSVSNLHWVRFVAKEVEVSVPILDTSAK